MELWIRSQDRETLMLCKRLSIIDKDIRDDGTDSYIINADNGAWDYDIGLYKTKERSLEVLDEIQTYIEKQGTTEILSENGIPNHLKYYGNVYEMPKE